MTHQHDNLAPCLEYKLSKSLCISHSRGLRIYLSFPSWRAVCKELHGPLGLLPLLFYKVSGFLLIFRFIISHTLWNHTHIEAFGADPKSCLIIKHRGSVTPKKRLFFIYFLILIFYLFYSSFFEKFSFTCLSISGR